MKKILQNKYFYFITIIILILTFLILSILGNIERSGYLTNFNLIKKTATNEYSYGFRISYYSKIFRNSDIYYVYPKLNNLPDYVKTIKMDKKGSPFGTLVSTKELKYDDKIDNIKYQLKIKLNIYYLIIFLCIILMILYNYKIVRYFSYIKLFYLKNNHIFIKFFTIFCITLFIIILIFSFLGRNIERSGYLTNFNLIKKTATNEYSYGFRISYYSKIFRNSDIYDVYPNLNNLPNYIKTIKMDKKGSPFGTLISTKELKYDDKIDNIKYYLMLSFDIFYYIVIFFIILLFFKFVYFLKEYHKYKKSLQNEKYYFITIIEISTILLLLFQYWLLNPGYYQYTDTWRSIVGGLYNISNNWDPVINDLSVKFIDKIGFTMDILFLVNLFLWYGSLFLIIISLYLKFNNKFVIVLLLISFILPIFIYNSIYLKDSVSTLYVIFAYSLIFFIVLNNIRHNRNILLIIALISLIIGMLHRHNFIVTIYPAFIWFVYDFLKNKNIISLKKYLLIFFSLMFIISISLVSIYTIFPKIFIKDMSKTTTNIISYIQIAGCVVPANDYSLIPDYWYKEGKSFDDVVKTYNSNKTFADLSYNYFDTSKTPDVKKVWIKSIIKYPLNYIKHIFNFTKETCTQKFYDPTVNIEGYVNNNVLKRRGITDFKNTKFFHDNRGIKFTYLREKIFNFIKNYIPDINILIFVIISIFLLLTTFIFILKKDHINSLLIFCFSTSFSAVSTMIIVVLYSPSTRIYEYRYIYPVISISIISLIGFISFLIDEKIIEKLYQKIRGK